VKVAILSRESSSKKLDNNMPDGDTRCPAAVLAKILRSDVLSTGNMIWSLNLERYSCE